VLLLSGRTGLPTTITVAGHRWQNARLILSVEGIEDRTAAETLRGAVLEAEVDLTETGEDEFHDLALVGLAVRQSDGTQLGRISEVLHLPGQDVLAVARTDGAELLVPFVRQMVPEVDIPGGFVVVELPDGLAELA
jgi:16S rRNA processing protein RimM